MVTWVCVDLIGSSDFRLKMNVRCAQELSIVQILTRRWFFSSLSLNVPHGVVCKNPYYIFVWVVLCRFLKLMSSSFLKRSAERFVIIAFTILKLLNILNVFDYQCKECTNDNLLDNLFDAGLPSEATRGLSPFHSYCFCWVCDGNCLFFFISACWIFCFRYVVFPL